MKEEMKRKERIQEKKQKETDEERYSNWLHPLPR
jgi:hypothetical protein